MVSHEAVGRVGDAMRLINPAARIVHLSTVRGDGLETLIQATQEITARV
jgi:hypothetical protein